MDRIEALKPKRLKGVAISSYGGEELLVDYPKLPGMKSKPTSLSVPRYELDSLLIDETKRAGAVVQEQCKVTDFLFENGCVAGVKGWDANKISFSIRSLLVIDAGGRNSLSLKKFKLELMALAFPIALFSEAATIIVKQFFLEFSFSICC